MTSTVPHSDSSNCCRVGNSLKASEGIGGGGRKEGGREGRRERGGRKEGGREGGRGRNEGGRKEGR